MTASNTTVSAAAAEADRVVKRQKLCSTKFSSTVDNLLCIVNSSKAKLDQSSEEPAEVIEALKRQITQLNVSSDLHDQTKQLHSAIGKLGKVNAVGGMHIGVLGAFAKLFTFAGTRKSICARYIKSTQAYQL